MTVRRVGIIVLAVATLLFFVGASPAEAKNYGDSRTELGVSPETAPYGQPLAVSATVWDDSTSCDIPPFPYGCNAPSGTVYWFLDGSPNYMASAPLERLPGPDFSTAGPVDVYLPTGTHDITARYYTEPSNTANRYPFNGSEETESVTITKGRAEVTLGPGDPNPSERGRPASFAVTVAPNPVPNPASGAAHPTGTVQLTEGPTVLAEGTLDGAGHATLTTDDLTIGDHENLAIAYLGDANYDLRASNEVTQTVVARQPSPDELGDDAFARLFPTVTLDVTPTLSHRGEAVTLSASVAPGPADGTVTFRDGSEALATVPVESGDRASFTTSDLEVGTHLLTAEYSGDSIHFASSSDPVQHVVMPSRALTPAPTPAPPPDRAPAAPAPAPAPAPAAPAPAPVAPAPAPVAPAPAPVAPAPAPEPGGVSSALEPEGPIDDTLPHTGTAIPPQVALAALLISAGALLIFAPRLSTAAKGTAPRTARIQRP